MGENTLLRLAVLLPLLLVACPDSDDPSATSATEATGTSSSTGDPSTGDLPDEGDSDTEPSTSTGDSTSTGSSTSTNSTGDGFCGDGTVDMDEVCDDGELNDMAGPCTLLCTLTCGDGEIQAGEECDLGQQNSDTGTCTKACRDARCGDEFIQPGETCDDGDDDNTVDPGGCHPVSCTDVLSACGNGSLDEGEECDPTAPGEEATDCTSSCLYASRTIFTTTQMYMSGFDLDTANDTCSNLAKDAQLEHWQTFIAALGTSDEPLSSRLGSFGGQYVNTKGERVALANDKLFSGMLEAEVDRDEHGQTVNEGSTFAWTGSLHTGASSGLDCEAWESVSLFARGSVGLLGAKDATWLSHMDLSCNTSAHLYCVQTGH